MPAWGEKEQSSEPIVVQDPVVVTEIKEEPRYETSVVRSEEVDLRSLVTHISGQTWTVDYFQQILGADQVGKELDSTAEAAYQQYRKIRNYQLKVSSELSQSENSETKVFEVTGASNMFPGLTPNQNDIFIGDIGDGRAAIFTITSTRRLTIYKESAFEVNYTLTTRDTDQFSDLENKVVETLWFNREESYFKGKVFLTTEEVETELELLDTIGLLNDEFFHEFFDHEAHTLLQPNGYGRGIYDPYFIDFWKKMDLPHVDKIRKWNTNGMDLGEETNIWECFRSGRLATYNQLTHVDQQPPVSLSRLPTLGGLAWSNVELMHVPFKNTPPEPIANEEQVLFPNLAVGEYVFSKWFYDEDEDNQSMLELLTHQWFEQQHLNKTVLTSLINQRHDLTPTQRFYVVPILIVLLHSLL